jgi:hypothetical protein
MLAWSIYTVEALAAETQICVLPLAASQQL